MTSHSATTGAKDTAPRGAAPSGTPVPDLRLGPQDRPFLPRGVRLAQDRVRGQTVLLAPEKAVALDTVGVAILSRVNGVDSVQDIVADLATTYNAPPAQIMEDVQRFLMALRARVFVGVQV
ncbi:pyrroloquinoline quinone biosynthesis protein D [Thalassovita litoralis]|uniref:Pyrroloquinoline quinone biosynthesis protein D n=1 Tax=Thalassovita litoralis TaxID=1010611 RepID=A0A521FLD8_9RHOB|nr:pyrroloquinoline quinone biosynthesis peptide chaperone PqqD [Thalassovita litoralis]SMO96390.1 pyrroloquinoline quinone biosynthesis protein D [Thalassovita litoralis]